MLPTRQIIKNQKHFEHINLMKVDTREYKKYCFANSHYLDLHSNCVFII